MPSRNPAPYLHLCPRAVATANLHQLNLSPQEALLWSRADGSTSLTQLADMTGRPVDEVFDMLTSLQDRAVIVWPDAAPVRPVGTTARGPALRASPPPAPSAHPALQEPGDLTYDERLRILTMEALLDTQTYWELLGVGAASSAGDVKKAYFQASKAFHPDRYFGKKLGSFAARLDRVFQHIKQASDTLTDPAARAAYQSQHPPAPEPAAPAPRPAAPATPEEAERAQRLEAHRASLRGGAGKTSLKALSAERAAHQAYKAQNFTRARIWAEQAVQLDPNSVRLRLLAAEVCEALGDLLVARKHLEHAASLDNRNVDVKNKLARLAHGKSDRH